jgi:lipid biosynthesis B12-binding/radical SAM protein
MSRVFLLSSNTATEPHAVYPLGMAVVAAGLSKRGHEVRQFDFLAAGGSLPRLRDAVEAFDPEVVGISLRNIDSTDSLSPGGGWHLEFVQELMGALRESTRAPVVVGGPAFSIMPEEILEFLGADYGVVGEGELAFPDLVETLAGGGSAPRMVSGSTPLRPDEMPTPLWDKELVDFYRETSGHVNYQTKRGCPHHCGYCTYPGLEGSRLRLRAPESVADDLERLAREHGVEEVFFTDSVFNDAEGHYLRIAEELIRRNLNLRWCALIRPQRMGRGEVALLKRAGLRAVEFGTDAGSDIPLAELGKGFTFADVLEVNRAFVQEEIPCAHFIMFGGPGETETTVAEGLANIAKLEKCVVFAFSGIRILPNAPLYARAVREGAVSRDAPLLRPVHYFSPNIRVEAMNLAIAEAFRGRRDRLFPPGEAEERLAVMRRFGFRGLLWDRLISFGPEKPLVAGRAPRGRRLDA